MEKEFIPYEQALALKELGFDESTYTWRQHGNGISGDVEGRRDYYNRKGDVYVALPTYSQAFRWFREKNGLYPCVASYFGGAVFGIEDKNTNYHNKLKFTTHEEAELACLAKLIEIAKVK